MYTKQMTKLLLNNIIEIKMRKQKKNKKNQLFSNQFYFFDWSPWILAKTFPFAWNETLLNIKNTLSEEDAEF